MKGSWRAFFGKGPPKSAPFKGPFEGPWSSYYIYHQEIQNGCTLSLQKMRELWGPIIGPCMVHWWTKAGFDFIWKSLDAKFLWKNPRTVEFTWDLLYVHSACELVHAYLTETQEFVSGAKHFPHIMGGEQAFSTYRGEQTFFHTGWDKHFFTKRVTNINTPWWETIILHKGGGP